MKRNNTGTAATERIPTNDPVDAPERVPTNDRRPVGLRSCAAWTRRSASLPSA